MFCPKCGAQNPDGSAFCGGCGAPLGASAAPAPAPAAQPQAAYRQPRPAPAYQGARFNTPAPAHPRSFVGGMSLWTLISVVLMALAAVFMLQSLANINVAQMYSSFAGSTKVEGIPDAVGIGAFGLELIGRIAGYAGDIASVYSSDASEVTDLAYKIKNFSWVITAAWGIVYTLNIVALSIAVKTKGQSVKLLTAAGVAQAVFCIVWIVIITSIDGTSIMGAVTVSVSCSLFLWLALVAGLVSAALTVLQKLRILQ